MLALPPAAIPHLVWCSASPLFLTAVGGKLVWVTQAGAKLWSVWCCAAAELGHAAPEEIAHIFDRSQGSGGPCAMVVTRGHVYLAFDEVVVVASLGLGRVRQVMLPLDFLCTGLTTDGETVWVGMVDTDDVYRHLRIAALADPTGPLKMIPADASVMAEWLPDVTGEGRVSSPPVLPAAGQLVTGPAGRLHYIDNRFITLLPEGVEIDAVVKVGQSALVGDRGDYVVVGPERGYQRGSLRGPGEQRIPSRVVAATEAYAVLHMFRRDAPMRTGLVAVPLATIGEPKVDPILILGVLDQITSVAVCEGRLFWALATGAIGATPLDAAGAPVPVAIELPQAPPPKPPSPELVPWFCHMPGFLERVLACLDDTYDALVAAADGTAGRVEAPVPWPFEAPSGWLFLALARYWHGVREGASAFPSVFRPTDVPVAGVSGAGFIPPELIYTTATREQFFYLRAEEVHPGWHTIAPLTFSAPGFLQWFTARPSIVEERAMRWLPGADLASMALGSWLSACGATIGTSWITLPPELDERLLACGALLPDELPPGAWLDLARLVGDAEIAAPASADADRLARAQIDQLDYLVHTASPHLLSALRASRRGQALVDAVDRLLIATPVDQHTILVREAASTLEHEPIPSVVIQRFVMTCLPRRWPPMWYPAAARYLLARDLAREPIHRLLRYLVGEGVVGPLRDAPADNWDCPGSDWVTLALVVDIALAEPILRLILSHSEYFAVRDAIDLAIAIDAPWTHNALRAAAATGAPHLAPLNEAIAYLDTRTGDAPFHYGVLNARGRLAGLDVPLAALAGAECEIVT